MKLGIILNTKDPETGWNAFRLANQALSTKHEVTMFLLGNGVEIQNVKDEAFDIAERLGKFLDSGGELLACGTCLKLRQQEAGVCAISSMAELVEVISRSDKVVTFG